MYSTVTTVLPFLIVAISVIILCSNHSDNTSESVSDDSITCAPWHALYQSKQRNVQVLCFQETLVRCTDYITNIINWL